MFKNKAHLKRNVPRAPLRGAGNCALGRNRPAGTHNGLGPLKNQASREVITCFTRV